MNIGGYNFTGPYDPYRGFTENFAAVYTIVDDTPKVIDVGQTGNINERFPNHDRQNCWPLHASGSLHLYVYREGIENTRLQIEEAIRSRYNPPCGVK